MSNSSILTLGFYIIALLIIWYNWRKNYTTEIFRVKKKLHWLTGAVSVFMFINSPVSIQIIFEVIQKDGLSGLWLLNNNWIVAAMAPMVFAPMWNKLALKTDNDFILLRFSGSGAKTLFLFRAIYLGVIIAPILVSYQLFAFAGLLSFLWDLPMSNAILIAGIVLIISSWKNSLGINLRTDVLHGLLFLLTIMLILIILIQHTAPMSTVINTLSTQHPGMTNILPLTNDHKGWAELSVLLGIQWWSTALFDGGGPEMQKYNSVEGSKRAIYVAMGGLVLTAALFLLSIFICILAMSINPNGFFSAIKSSMHPSLKMFITLGFWAAFISTAEGIINWGSSLIIENAWYRTKEKPSSIKKSIYSLLLIFLLTAISALITISHNTLKSILELFLAFSAGVAPVFFLRWFWMRINAWAQLTAMIAGTVFSLLYQYIEPYFAKWLNDDLLDPFYWKMIILTIITTISWITVMYLTPADDIKHIQHFRKLLPAKQTIIKRIGIALGLGILLLAAYVAFISIVVGNP